MSDEPSEIEEEMAAAVRASWSLPWATSLALRALRLALDDLSQERFTRRRRERTLTLVQAAIRDLECGLRNAMDTATGDLSKDLLRALDPMVTVAELEGARAVLRLMLAALPPERELSGRTIG